MNIDLVCQDNPRDIRLEMFAFVKRFREAKVRVKIGEQDYEIWTAAARPPAIRAHLVVFVVPRKTGISSFYKGCFLISSRGFECEKRTSPF